MPYLQRTGTNGKTPFPRIKRGNKWKHIRGDKITAANRSVIRAAVPAIGFIMAYISARSLRARGAMALLMVHAEPDTIHLVGRWRSGMILHFLQMIAKSFT